MTEELDLLVSAYDTHWDGAIITKPPILSKLMNEDAQWFPNPRSIKDVDSLIVYPYEGRIPIPKGTDGSGKEHITESWFFPVYLGTTGIGSPSKDARLEKLYEGAEDCLVKANEAGTYIYQNVGCRDASSKGKPPSWLLIVTVKMTKPNRKLTT